METLIETIITRLNEVLDLENLGQLVADLLVNMVSGLLIFFVFYLIWLGVGFIARRVLRRSRVDQTNATFILALVKYTILTVGGVNALAAASVDTASLLASLGIAGITIGFAARDAFSNLISGLLIYLDRPFVIGDLIEVGDSYGKVDQITLRSTRIITSDGKMLAVPNTDIINKIVASYTNFPNLRLDIPVTVGVNEDLSRVRAILLDIVDRDPAYMSEPAPRVVVTQLNDYNVGMELQAWIHDERSHVDLRSILRERVFTELNRAGVEMPFETIQLAPMQVDLASTSAQRNH
ncbi:MAG: mechanosensitive ion channel family protein [Anaerolineales bacterium]|nr:mechanosensitive ion channel family protein [Anaerolineales bacterium]